MGEEKKESTERRKVCKDKKGKKKGGMKGGRAEKKRK